MARAKSVEPNITDLANGWLKSYGLDYKLEQEPLNDEIDKALDEYHSKSGGKGGNRPDVKLLLESHRNPDKRYPVLIEYKGYKDKLVKLDEDGRVFNRKKNGEPHYANIKNYAVNGAVHYANALLHHTSYANIIAIGMTGWKDESGKLRHEISVWHVSRDNLGAGQKIGDFQDLSFLKPEHFDEFIERVENLALPQEELDALKARREHELDASLTKLNNHIFKEEKGLSENDRVHLVAATIIATLGIPGKVAPLEKADLKSSAEPGNTDGEIIMRKIEAFLDAKGLPQRKRELIVRALKNTLLAGHVNKVVNGETQLKRVFCRIVDDIGIYYKIGLTTDFTGKLFNEMYNWLGFTQDKMNDVVLTPSYVATLLARLARVNKDSYVWDFATGSAGLLVAAMNEMLADARKSIASPEELARKEAHIKAKQLLGLEILPSVYMLAVLNMILMGDGCSNILNEDSLHYFEDEHGDEAFPARANAFVLNPPYSAPGCGMVFVEKALEKMRSGYAAVIIQSSAGSGKAAEYNRRILKHSTLIASIRMPDDLFVGKSSVQTRIYVFRVGEPHQPDDVVKFIDFSNDGYARSNRKKARTNLRDVDRARERYDELVALVRFGRSKLRIFTEKEYYEGTIDPNNGADWNQSAPRDLTPTLEDFKKTVGDYLAWEIQQILKGREAGGAQPGKTEALLNESLKSVEWGEFRLGDIFTIQTPKRRFDANKVRLSPLNGYPYVVRRCDNNGWRGLLDEAPEFLNPGNTISFGQDTATVFYQQIPYFTGDKIKVLKAKSLLFGRANALFFVASIAKAFSQHSWGAASFSVEALREQELRLPSKGGAIDFGFMDQFIAKLESDLTGALWDWLTESGLDDCDLTEDELRALDDLERHRVEWGEFRLGALFDRIAQGKRLKKDDQLPGNTPFVMAGTSNQGVVNYVANPVATFPANAITADIFGNVFYRNFAFGAGDDTGVYWNEENNTPKPVMLFLASSMSRALAGRFSYGNKLRSSRSLNIRIKLPAKNGAPDYEWMALLISAVQKLLLRGVVAYLRPKSEAASGTVRDHAGNRESSDGRAARGRDGGLSANCA